MILHSNHQNALYHNAIPAQSKVVAVESAPDSTGAVVVDSSTDEPVNINIFSMRFNNKERDSIEIQELKRN